MTKFWIRGQSVSLLGLCAAVYQMEDKKKAATICAATSMAIGLFGGEKRGQVVRW